MPAFAKAPRITLAWLAVTICLGRRLPAASAARIVASWADSSRDYLAARCNGSVHAEHQQPRCGQQSDAETDLFQQDPVIPCAPSARSRVKPTSASMHISPKVLRTI
jgi:hypothetical protein